MDAESQPHSSETDEPKEDSNTSAKIAKGNASKKHKKKRGASNKHRKHGSEELLQERIVEKKLISCKECGRQFSRLDNLERHQKIHLGIGASVTCYECGKQFKDTFALKVHQKTHERKSYGVRTKKGKVVM